VIVNNSGDKPGFIVPPPGLIPSRGAEETTPPPKVAPLSFPVFVPVPLGASPQPAAMPSTPVPSTPVPSTPTPSTPLPGDGGQGAPLAEAPAVNARLGNVLPQEDTLIPKIWRLTLADGQSFEASTSMVLGRDPAVVPVRPQAQRIPVTDPVKSVSKTHAIIDVDATELSVTDLHSTNGVIVTRPDGRQDDLPPGGRAVLAAGSRVLLGEFAIDVSRE
jgi:FHA domain